MNFETSVPFDPGYGKYMDNFAINMDYIMETLHKIKNFNQKKFQYKKFYPLILKDLEKNISFYLGCMLWAVYLKQFDNKPIEGNHSLGMEYDEDNVLPAMYFVLDYIEQIKKDSKYYLGTTFTIDDFKINIINIYIEFLKANKGFVDTKTTNEIQIPFEIHNPDYEKILSTVEKATSNGDFTVLYELKKTILG